MPVVATGAKWQGVWGDRRDRAGGIRCSSDRAVQDGSRTSLRPSSTCIPRRIRRTGSYHRGKCSRHRDRRSARLGVQRAARACRARRDGRSAALHDSCRRRDRTAPTRNLCPLCIHCRSVNILSSPACTSRYYRIPGSTPRRFRRIGRRWEPGGDRCSVGRDRVDKRVLVDRRRPPRGAGPGAEREGFYRGNRGLGGGLCRRNCSQAVQSRARTGPGPSNTCIPRRIRKTGSDHRGKGARHIRLRVDGFVVQKAPMARRFRRCRSAALQYPCRRRDHTSPTGTERPRCMRRRLVDSPCARGRRSLYHRTRRSNPYRFCRAPACGWRSPPVDTGCLGRGRTGRGLQADRGSPARRAELQHRSSQAGLSSQAALSLDAARRCTPARPRARRRRSQARR
jgi:hypothetical protein